MSDDQNDAKEAEKLTGDALTIAFLKANLEDLRTGGIVTVAMTNPNVMSYMEHWEGRAEKAEARVKVLEEALEPFAKWVNAMETNEFLSGSRFSHWSDDYHPVDTLPLSAFRRARNALKSEGEI